ncbi:alpha/beta hydrolase family protein [Catenuloplanes japonicus]|uniref:alpha/beta hydrolase family protein n=1 Tax=Catenuloplanes japonicus TaxID=33876 RepID=UPI0005244830|nr:hypothetical protein [Catenuloplanes japonicus]
MSFSEAGGIPVSTATPVITHGPVTLPVPGRPVGLQVKVSVPVTGDDLPVILMSHGHGPSHFISSLRGYGPVVDFWAAHGFAVIQPTHLDSTALGLREADDPDAPLYWRSRVTDMHHLLDHLADLPLLPGRIDPTRIAAVLGAEHGLGGVSMYDAAETTDENPERVATLRALIWSYLRTQLYPGDPAWPAALAALPASMGTIESK